MTLTKGSLTPVPSQLGQTQLPEPWQRRQRLVTSQSVLYSDLNSFWAAWRTWEVLV